MGIKGAGLSSDKKWEANASIDMGKLWPRGRLSFSIRPAELEQIILIVSRLLLDLAKRFIAEFSKCIRSHKSKGGPTLA